MDGKIAQARKEGTKARQIKESRQEGRPNAALPKTMIWPSFSKLISGSLASRPISGCLDERLKSGGLAVRPKTGSL